MANRRAIGASVLLVVVLAAGALVWSRTLRASRATEDFPDGIHMLCADAACGRAFTVTLGEIAKLRQVDEDAPVPCPACGKPAVRARVCPSCAGSFPSDRLRGTSDAPVCPLCEKPLPRLTGG